MKAFNPIDRQHLRDLPSGNPDRDPHLGDDAEAKRTVAGLIDEIGFDAVGAGSLAQGGRRHQQGTAVATSDLPTEQLRECLGARAQSDPAAVPTPGASTVRRLLSRLGRGGDGLCSRRAGGWVPDVTSSTRRLKD
ncbi:MAG: hypothetical protein ACXVRE_12450 [Gaiellaceae bacterium]